MIDRGPRASDGAGCPMAPPHGVVFDPVAARRLSAYEIRERFPRGHFTAESPCPGCGYVGIAYASFEHYVAGDW